MDSVETGLIRKAQRGDMKSFEELISIHDRRVLSLALRYTGNLEDAKDIYQEVFLRVFRSLDRFNFNSRFSTWLFRITTNVCLDHQAHSHRRRHLSLDAPESGEESSASLSRALAVKADSEQSALGAELAGYIGSALESLSPQQRIVFTLRHFEGHKLREIADILELSEGTVKKHLFSATHRMRDQLQGLLA